MSDRDFFTVGLDRAVGVVEARVDHLDEEIHEIRADIKTIMQALDERRGGVKMLSAVTATAGAFGAVLAEIINHITFTK